MSEPSSFGRLGGLHFCVSLGPAVMVFVASDNLVCSFALPEVLQGRRSLSRFRLQDQPCSTAAGKGNSGGLCPGIGHTPAPVWSGKLAERRQVCMSHTMLQTHHRRGGSVKRKGRIFWEEKELPSDVHPLHCILIALKHRLQ